MKSGALTKGFGSQNLAISAWEHKRIYDYLKENDPSFIPDLSAIIAKMADTEGDESEDEEIEENVDDSSDEDD